jgi:hypothetical protein
MRFVLLVLAVALGLASCGGDDDTVEAGNQPTTTTTAPTTTTTTSGEDDVSGDISLTVQVTAGGPVVREGTLTCDATGAQGTGFLADPAAAQAACDVLTANPAAVHRLANGREPGMLCTQQYGGPEVAKVSGTIGDARINQTITRTDGCGISEWNMLVALLGPPGF